MFWTMRDDAGERTYEISAVADELSPDEMLTFAGLLARYVEEEHYDGDAPELADVVDRLGGMAEQIRAEHDVTEAGDAREGREDPIDFIHHDPYA